jgi:hypothetical protein
MPLCDCCHGRKKIESDTIRLTELSYLVLTWVTCPRCRGVGRTATNSSSGFKRRLRNPFNKLLSRAKAKFKKMRGIQEAKTRSLDKSSSREKLEPASTP